MTPPPADPSLPTATMRASLWPATVRVWESADAPTHDVLTPTRVIVTLTHIYVFADGSPSPRLVFFDQITDYRPPTPIHRLHPDTLPDAPERSAQASLESGGRLLFHKAPGCGCGSKLKNASLQTLLNLNQSSAATLLAGSINDK